MARAVVGRAHACVCALTSPPPSPGFALRSISDSPAPAVGGSALSGLARLTTSPYLLGIAAYALCAACLATFVYLRQAELVKAAIPDRAARTAFFADVDLWTGVVTLAIQIALTAKNVIDTLVYRFGDFGSAWLNRGLVVAGVATAFVAVPLAALWFALALILGVGHRRRTRR